MARYKVPSQAASGGDSFSDQLVGIQFTTDSSQMTGANFAVEKAIPEKDSKQFITQPFSSFLTLDDIQKESNTTEGSSTSTSNVKTIKFNSDKNNADKSLYGSLKNRLLVSISDIITKFPAGVMVDSTSPSSASRNTADNITYDLISNTTEFQVQYGMIYNPLDVVLKKPRSSSLGTSEETIIRNFYTSYTKYVIDLSGTTYNILTYTEPDSNNRITIKVDGNCFEGYSAYTENYIIRPNNGVVESFYEELDDLQQALLNRTSNPIYNAGFNVPRDTNTGYITETITEYVNWPLSRDGWNIQIIGLEYEYYINKLSSLGDEIDRYKSDLIIRFLTSPQLYEFDTEEKKIESIFQIYGQSFDKVKLFIDNIAYMRNVSYDAINNVPDILLKNLSETLGLSTVSLFDEKTLQDSLYTRHDAGYDGISTGTNLIEAEYEFYRRILVNIAWLFKSKGTRKAIEFFLRFIGAPEPMIRLDEYIYRVDGSLPSKDVESDIQDVILGTKVSNIVEYIETTGTTAFTGYTLTQLTGTTDLTREEYPVDEITGLPRGIEYSDGSMFFAKGAGWYRKTLDHRSPDIIDEANSDFTGRVKVIKTMAKPFTYGEEYFDVYRSLPGLGYGYNLISEIDNQKIEVVENESTSSLILNRKNINVFLSADRAIDYDIYRKSRDLSITFHTLTPQSGVTFAEFLDQTLSNLITNSHVIRYKPFYVDLYKVYREYQLSTTFTPYNYISVNDFINRLSPYWINIVEQFIPATTQWTGGNLIDNGIFNRSKFKHRQPCVPLVFSEDLYPSDIETVLHEDIETIIGSGSIDGEDVALENFRGLQVLNGISFDVVLEVNGISYTGATFNLQPFTGFTPSSDCTILTATVDSIPLICGYSGNTFNGGDSIDDIKAEWKTALNTLVEYINTIYTGETGFKISLEYFLDTNDVEQVRFKILFNEYYGCNGETFDYLFEPTYDITKQECDLQIGITATNTEVFDDISSCQLSADLQFNIVTNHAVGDEMGNWPIYIRTGCTEDVNNTAYIQHSSGCQFVVPSIREIDRFGMLFTDAANCEQKIKVDGLQPVIINNSGTSGYTAVARAEYKPTYNFGLRRGNSVYVLNYFDETPPSGYTQMEEWISTGRLLEMPVENLLTGYTILSVELKPYSQMTSSQFRDASISGYSFAFNYSFKTLTASDCLSTTKTSIINGQYEVLPTSKVLVYTNVDTNLEAIPYRFEWKYPQDIFERDSTESPAITGDYIIDYRGFGIEVSGVTLDYCTYDKTFYQLNFEDSIDGSNNIVINGVSGTSYNKLIVSFEQEGIDPLTFDIHQLFIGLGYDESSPINTIRVVDPGWGTCSGGVPVPSTTPVPTITPSRTPTPTRSIGVTPSRSVTPSITPSLSVSSTVTPSLSVSSTVTPSISVTPTVTPTIPEPTYSVTPTVTASVTPSISVSASVTPSISVSRTITPSVSVSPSYVPEAKVNFESLSGDIASVGFTGTTVTGRTFTIAFDYLITATVDNVWSGGQYPVEAHTYFYLSTDSGSTYSEVDFISASVPGYGPPDESDSQSRQSTYILYNITEEELRGIRIYGQYDCSWAQDQQGGTLDVTITGISSNFGIVNIICNNKYSVGCLSTTTLSCGPEVTPTPSISFGWTPTPTRTPSITPTESPTQFIYTCNLYSCYGGVCADLSETRDYEFTTYKIPGKYYISTTGTNILYIVSGTTSGDPAYDVVGPYDTCESACSYVPSPSPTRTPTPSPTGYDYFYSADVWSCALGECNDEITSEDIASYVPLIVGRWYTFAEDNIVYYITGTASSGTARNMIGGPFSNCTDACSSPMVTPSAQAPSPSLTRTPSRTPSVTYPTQSVTPSISRTPTPSRQVIGVDITNGPVGIETNSLITNCTISGLNLVNFATFPLYPGDSGYGESPVGNGTYTITVSITGSRINNMHMEVWDSDGTIHCQNIYPSTTEVIFLGCAVNTSGTVQIYFYDSGLCPTATPSVTRSVSVSRTPTTTPPTPSVTPTLGGSPTPTPTPSGVVSLQLDYYNLMFNESGLPCDTNIIAVTVVPTGTTWTASPAGDIAPYLNINGQGWGNNYIGTGNESITVECSTGDIYFGYIVFSATGLSPNVNCSVSTGMGCT